jgi:hypothetical protein
MMDFGLSTGWQLGLSIVIPVALALIILTAEAHGPLSAPIQSCKGMVGPYFNAIALVFGLFAALLASDAWQKDTQARRIINDEGAAARIVAQTARAMGVEASVLPKLKLYLEASSAENETSPSIVADRAKTERAYEELLTALVRAPGLDPPSRAILIGDTRGMMKSHDDRVYLADDFTMPIKRLAIVLFGALTQVAIMLVHVGYRRPMRVAVYLFTVAFSACLILAAIFDSPFENLMPHEPKTTLGLVLKTL